MITGNYTRYVDVFNDGCLIAFITNTIILVLVQLKPMYSLFGSNRRYFFGFLYIFSLFLVTNFITFVLTLPFTGVLWLAYTKLVIFQNLEVISLSSWIVAYLAILWALAVAPLF